MKSSWMQECFVEGGDTIEEIGEKVVRVLDKYQDSESETYISTRSQRPVSNGDVKFFSDVVMEGLAPNGGLYVPNKGFPKLRCSEWIRLVDMSYPERALVILEKCIHPLDIAPSEFRSMVTQDYGQNFASKSVAPVKHLAEGSVHS